MITVDTSAVLAIVLGEAEAETFEAALRREAVLIGWPTLFEFRIVLAVKGFGNAAEIAARLASTPNVIPDRSRLGTMLPPRLPISASARGVPRRASSIQGGADFPATDVLLHPDAATLGGGRQQQLRIPGSRSGEFVSRSDREARFVM